MKPTYFDAFIDAFDWLDFLAHELAYDADNADGVSIIKRDVKQLRRLAKTVGKLNEQVEDILDTAEAIDRQLYDLSK